VLLTVFRFGHLARRVQLDVLLTGLELGALLLFWTLDRSPRRDPRRVAGFHACLGLALLTKGPVGLLPLAVAGAFLVWEGRGRTLSRALPAWGWLLTLGPVLAWLGAALALAPPGFFQEAVVENLVGRFFEGTSHARPFTYYLVQLPLDFLPWTLLWPAVFIEARRLFRAPPGPAVEAERRTWRFLLAWVGVFFVFFSLSAGKRGLYLLPAFPALALLVGRALDLVLARRVTWPAGLRVALGAVAAVVGCAGLAIALAGGLESPAAPGFALPPAVGWAAAGAMVLAAGLALRAPGRTTPAVRHTLATVVGLGALEAVVLTVAYPAFDPEKSPRPVAQAAVDATPGDGAIGVFDHRAMLGGLAYYSGRRVVALPDAGAVARFWSDGGGAVVVRRTRLERLAGAGPRREVATVRSGRRAVAVVVPGEALPARATRSSSDSAAP
jgi:4-amino-4-deoxy-L-arabinose transferase-like glycosyltransferase